MQEFRRLAFEVSETEVARARNQVAYPSQVANSEFLPIESFLL
jgi:hypothetical protein